MTGHKGGEVERIETQLESTLESVDQAEDIVLDVAERLGFDEDARHQIGMAVRESMVNAVVHGNKYNAQKRVHLIVDSSGGRLAVRVIDQGDGFDPGNLPDPLAPENLLRQSGRGLLLMQAFVDEFKVFRAQPAGTEVLMVKHLPQN